MLDLIPIELHRYSLSDIVLNLIALRKLAGKQATINLPGLGDGIPIRSARAALIIALKALGVPPGSRIGIPLYCCPVVFKAISAADCVPTFLDIDAKTFCISAEDLRAKRSKVDALIAVHMFGNLCDMPTILNIMDGKPVIEDCAQSIGSRHGDQVCGSFGQVAFFSFRSGKYLSAGEGAALFSEHKDLYSRMSQLTSELDSPARVEEIRHIFVTFIRSKLRSRPWWGLLGKRIWSAYNRNTEFINKSPIVLGRIFASDLETIQRRMPELNLMISSQRANAAYFEQNLQLFPSNLCYEGSRYQYNRFIYPIIFPSSAQRNSMITYLRKRGIDTASPYEEVVAGVIKHYGYNGECPSAENALRKTLLIPCSYTLKSFEIKHITQSLNQGWAEIQKKETNQAPPA